MRVAIVEMALRDGRGVGVCLNVEDLQSTIDGYLELLAMFDTA